MDVDADAADVTVTDNPDASRFETTVDGELAVAVYERSKDVITFTHTEVPPALEGKGIASALARTALDQARADRLRVVPRCRFIAAYIKRHRQYEDLVAKP